MSQPEFPKDGTGGSQSAGESNTWIIILVLVVVLGLLALCLCGGLAAYILVLLAAYRGTDREIGDAVVRKLGRLLGVFVALVLYFTVVQHLANLYAAEHTGVERFILRDGRLRSVPTSPLAFMASDILPLTGKLRLFAEPFARRKPPGDETVFEFASRRIGPRPLWSTS